MDNKTKPIMGLIMEKYGEFHTRYVRTPNTLFVPSKEYKKLVKGIKANLTHGKIDKVTEVCGMKIVSTDDGLKEMCVGLL